ncbi:peptidase E [Idiomarina sp. A28L]|uniref:dipeptidase PepE n=1 Tax=Idiomarina sp. A28L TaxID=1036674 RepID=UPI0002138A10|nr:dipeptidase PepE [Idiomarina sp. A28L]EGN75839.1 peptidase E [Idiomarina sp. A28L]
MRNLLLMSSSKAGNSEYLNHGKQWLSEHFRGKEVLFIPYAGVTMSHTAYSNRVAEALADTDVKVRGIETFTCPKAAIENAEGILVGGGNTFVLLDLLYRKGLIDSVKRQIKAGVPYAGWSAGSNIAGLSIRTTNDMPIVQPPSFNALAAVNFQLNPHYIDTHPPGFHGETRAQRLAEFMVLNPGTTTIGIREGTALKVQGAKMQLLGTLNGVAFRDGRVLNITAGKDCSTFL